MRRVISYVDGFNLYYGLRDKEWQKYYWLDVAAVSRALLKPGQTLARCYYFTARIKDSKPSQQSQRKQKIWLDALATRTDIECRFGHYLHKEASCVRCNYTWQQPEEKMTDVNIATQLLIDAYEDNFDTALIMSADSDLTTPIGYIRKRFPKKRVVVVFPPRRHSNQLRQTAHACLRLSEDKLRNNLLPDEITDQDGFVLRRPEAWR